MVYSWRTGCCNCNAEDLAIPTHFPVVVRTEGVLLLDLVIVRAIFILVIASCAFALQPFNSSPWVAAAGGLVVGGCIIFFEIRLEQVSLKRLIGAAVGSVLGIFGAFLMTLVLGSTHK